MSQAQSKAIVYQGSGVPSESVKVQSKGDRVWVKLENLGYLLGADPELWLRGEKGRAAYRKISQELGTDDLLILSSDGAWAIDALALEFAYSVEYHRHLADWLKLSLEAERNGQRQ
jgi:hypothetical protein